MIIRYALFEGKIHEGREAEFRAFVKERLVPLWTKFPGAEEVRGPRREVERLGEAAADAGERNDRAHAAAPAAT